MTISKKTHNGVKASKAHAITKRKKKKQTHTKAQTQSKAQLKVRKQTKAQTDTTSKTNNKLENTDKNTDDNTDDNTINYKNGIYDINGEYDNPLTNKPYINIKAHENTSVGNEILPKTYANLAKSWSKKLVYKIKDNIINTIVNNQIILLTAGTGVGKTILVPRIALHAFNYKSKVLCTIPKRIPTLNAASYVAECMDVNIGEEVGYYYQGINQTNKNGIESKLIFTTTGSLLSRMTGSDPLLSDYKCVIVDEAHERSVQTDQLLLLLKKACIERPELTIIIMSATISLQLFRNYYPKKQFKFGEIDAGTEVSFPIKQKWVNTTQQTWQPTAIDLTIKILQSNVPGDIIIFVKSGGDARKLCGLLNAAMSELRKKIKAAQPKSKTKTITQKQANTTAANTTTATKPSVHSIPPEYLINPLCLTLEGSTSTLDERMATDANQYKTIKDANGYPYTRKVVITTNVAESSITVEGVVFVIDSGYEYTDSYEPNSRVRMLLESTIAQSAVQQRKGRVGRTQPGYCIHLYSEDTYKNFEEYPTPSIEKSDITNDILDLMRLPEASTIKKMRHLLNEFISPPHEKFIINSIRTLEALGAITDITPTGTITPMGFALSKFRAIKAPFARALIASFFYGCARSVCDVIALVTTVDGMIGTIYADFRPDKKKTPEWNKTEEHKHMRIIKSYSHPLGDYMTLLKTYRIYLQQHDKYKNGLLPPKDNIILAHAIQKTKKHSHKQNGGKSSHTTTKKISRKATPLQTAPPKDEILDVLDVLDVKDIAPDDIKTKKDKDPPEVKKWCRDNYLNSNKLHDVKRISKQLYDTLMKIVRPYNNYNDKKYPDKMSGGFLQRIEQQEAVNKLEPVVKRFDNEDDNILMSLAIGNFVNFAIKSSSNSSDNTYTSCFAKDKTKLCKINKDSFLTSYPKLIMFDELFCGMRGAKFVKINIVNKIPDHIFNQLKLLYGNKINYTI